MGSPTARSQAALAVLTLTWGSPLVHRLLNADPNPGNFLVEELPDGGIHLWCLDFGCAREVPVEMRDADRELWWAILEEDSETAAERFRMGLAASGLLRRADSLATAAHREWERRLAEPFTTHGSFHWGDPYARALAEATGRVLSAGGIRVPPELLLLWRQRLGAAAVIGMLDARAPFRRTLHDLIGSGRRALR
jgi:predicted unusual protein kinase regulating ubiquinone biosynthesis (AarF/ABC1/UbiB family)